MSDAGPFVALPPLTPTEARLVRDLIACAIAGRPYGANEGTRAKLLWPLHTAFAEAVQNYRGPDA